MRGEAIPSDQFEVCKRELSRLSLLMEQIGKSMTIAQNMHLHEAQNAMYECRRDIETAGYWLGKALKLLSERREQTPR